MKHDPDNEQLSRVQEIFAQAIELPPEQRTAFIRSACGDDAELRGDLESLLEHDASAGNGFLAPPAPPDAIRQTPVDDEYDTLIGREIGGYRIIRLIGAGGMGAVFEALQKQPERGVALKVMQPGVGSPAAVQRFRDEAQLLARLQHPHIAHVYEAGVHEDADGRRPYFAMELIRDAASIIEYAERERLDTRARLRLFARVCDAVHHGHQKGVIHRDLKPSNILVDPSGEPKVIDFGVARTIEQDTLQTSRRTLTGQLIGTVQYMSPEQCGDDPNDLDTRSDVYSLGVVLYELLCGEPPYDTTGSSIVRAARIIGESPPTALTVHDRRLRGDVQTIVLKALEKDRERRYQSAAELAADIQRYLNREPIEARPPTPWTRLARWIARRPVAATVLLCLIILTSSIATSYLAVWYVNAMPDRFELIQDSTRAYGARGRAAILRSRTGAALQTWTSSSQTGVCLAKLVDRPAEFGGGRLAVIAARLLIDHGAAGPLLVYDPRNGFEDPLLIVGFPPANHIPVPPDTDRNYRPEDFIACTACVADIFPESPGGEIVVAANHHRYSQCVIQIYNLDGECLYRTWHDGVLNSCYWMTDARLLVFAGVNSECPWTERGVEGIDIDDARVIFAVRPVFKQECDEFLDTEAGAAPCSPVWYKCFTPLETMADFATVFECNLKRPYGAGLSRFVELKLTQCANPKVSLGFIIDAAGDEVPNSRIPNAVYIQTRSSSESPSLPDPDDIKLIPMPQRIKPAAAVPVDR